MNNDNDNAEFARREHNREMTDETAGDRAWKRFANAAEAIVIERGYCGTFDSGKPRGLDETDAEFGFSLDSAYEAFEKGHTVADYIQAVEADRASLGLSV